jgi:hypothetical protein
VSGRYVAARGREGRGRTLARVTGRGASTPIYE